MENSSENKKEKNDLYKVIDNIKNNTKVVEISSSKGIIYVPIWYSANAQIEYLKAYSKFKDYRKAFCFLAFSMIKDNVPQITQKISNIIIKDIEEVKDEDLINILNLVIAESDDLSEYYNNYSTGNYFEDFYKSIKYEESKCTKDVEHLLKIPKNIKSIFESPVFQTAFDISLKSQNYHKNLNIDNQMLNNIIQMQNLTKSLKINNSSYSVNKIVNKDKKNNLLSEIKPVNAYTNDLIKGLSDNIKAVQKEQIQYQEENNEYAQKMVELLDEEKKNRIQSEIENKKNSIKINKYNIMTITIAVLSLLVSVAGFLYTIIINTKK